MPSSTYCRRAPLVLLAAFVLFVLSPTPAFTQSNHPKSLTVGLAAGLGGLADSSFNLMQVAGLSLARTKYGITTHALAPESEAEDIPIMRRLIGMGCKVIIAGGGYHMVDPVDQLAREYPHVLFILLDSEALAYLPNVASVTFRQNEGSFLAGKVAAMASRTGVVAFLGATDIPVINDFYLGYAAGAKDENPEIEVLERYIDPENTMANPYSAPEVAKFMALDLYRNQRADVIFAVASESNKGVFSAALTDARFAIGVDADQDNMAPGFVLTSMMKRLDTAIVYVIGEIMGGRFKNANYSLGLAEEGVSLTPMTYTQSLFTTMQLRKLKLSRLHIVEGRIRVPSAFQTY